MDLTFVVVSSVGKCVVMIAMRPYISHQFG
jgi:hypothetical protein